VSIYIPLFRTLNKTGARYIVVGGFATVLHGYARLTIDVDLVIDLAPKQALKVIDALTDLGLTPRAPVDARGFADTETRARWIEEKGMQVFTMWDKDNPMRVVDLFVQSPIDFEGLYARSELVGVEDITIRIASILDLIQIKREAGRHKDIDDIKKLEQLYKLKHPKDNE